MGLNRSTNIDLQSVMAVFFASCFFLVSCTGQTNSTMAVAGEAKNSFDIQKTAAEDVKELKLSSIRLPQNFKIDVFAKDVDGARSMCLSPSGILYVGTRSTGKVYALVDLDGDFKADKQIVLAEGLRSPNGVAFKDGDLYVAEISRILCFKNIDADLENPKYEVFYDDYPEDGHHGWKYIAFGPDGKLYVPVGAPCNICEPDDPYASITRLNIETREREIVQRGIRNTVGFTWHPKTNNLWFTDNGRDWFGDNLPACELNRATSDDLHFGYPYCHQGDLPDDEFGNEKSCDGYVAPAQKLGPHVAPLGLKFGFGSQFPQQYQNTVFIAEHGSWNRSEPIGYRITSVQLNEDGTSKGYSIFADGWLKKNGSPWGRPVDILFLKDGSMLVSDDYGDAIYRIWYEAEK